MAKFKGKMHLLSHTRTTTLGKLSVVKCGLIYKADDELVTGDINKTTCKLCLREVKDD